jgi:hypothetical protein
MLYLGIDLHLKQKQMTVSLRNEHGDVLLRRQVSTRWPKLAEFREQLHRLRAGENYVAVLEVCGFHDWLVKWLQLQHVSSAAFTAAWSWRSPAAKFASSEQSLCSARTCQSSKPAETRLRIIATREICQNSLRWVVGGRWWTFGRRRLGPGRIDAAAPFLDQTHPYALGRLDLALAGA